MYTSNIQLLNMSEKEIIFLSKPTDLWILSISVSDYVILLILSSKVWNNP